MGIGPSRIVLVMLEPPLPFGNAAARWYYVLLRGLVSRGHRVTAFAACSSPQDIDKARNLFPAADYDLRLYPFPNRRGWMRKIRTVTKPYSYMFGPDLLNDLAGELKNGYDILHLEQLFTGWAALDHKDRALLNIHHLVQIDLQYVRSASFAERLNHKLMFRAENLLMQKFRNIRSCSPRLVTWIKERNPQARITTVPVGIDTTLYPWIESSARPARPVLGLIGSMGWYPSRSAAERLLGRLWPEIKRQVPESRVVIVGWSARSALKNYADMPDVTIEENVPDTRPYFENTSVMLYAPGRGSGMKIKILEAMAYGVPVVTTSEGVEGLNVEDGVHAGIHETDEGLISRAVELLRDTIRQERMRREARTAVERQCGPDPVITAIESIYADILSQSESPEGRGGKRDGH